MSMARGKARRRRELASRALSAWFIDRRGSHERAQCHYGGGGDDYDCVYQDAQHTTCHSHGPAFTLLGVTSSSSIIRTGRRRKINPNWKLWLWFCQTIFSNANYFFLSSETYYPNNLRLTSWKFYTHNSVLCLHTLFIQIEILRTIICFICLGPARLPPTAKTPRVIIPQKSLSSTMR